MPTLTLPPVSRTTSNVKLALYLTAMQLDQASSALDQVNANRDIATAQPEALQPNWGTLLQVAFDQSFTVDQYRKILLGTIQSRIKAPKRQCFIDMVHAYAPTAVVSVRDYFREPQNFIGPGQAPDATKFFTLNSTASSWNDQSTVWMPGRLMRSLGFDPFGSQVQVLSVANPAEIKMLTFVPPALEYVRPAHQFVALVFQMEVAGP